jgi:hypothetical protein
MKRLLQGWVVALAIFCWPGCKQADPDVLPQKKMKTLLTDLLVAEELAHTRAAKDSTLSEKDETIKLYTQVLELHQTTRKEFLTSFDYYLSRPETARAMFDSLSNQVRRNFTMPTRKPE